MTCSIHDCETSKIPGSRHCLKHWINQRYFLSLIVAYAAGFMLSMSPAITLIGLIIAIALFYFHGEVLEDLDDVQEKMLEEGGRKKEIKRVREP